MANFAALTVQLELQQQQFQRGMDAAAASMAKLQAQAKQSGGSLAGLERSFDAVGGAVRKMAGAFAAFKGVEAIVKAGDQIRSMEGAFTALLGSAARAGDMMGRVFDIVDKTGAPLDATAASLQRLTIALMPLGASNLQIARLTETFIKLGAVGRSSSEDVGNALRQLGQGLASGSLSGDELKSIRENVPLVAQAIADSLGVTTGKLKEMGAAGELNATVVTNALLKASAAADQAFANLPITFEQATNKMLAQATNFLAEMDKATGISNKLAIVVEYIANVFKRWHSELVVDQESLSQMQTLMEGVSAIATLIAKGFVYITAGIETSVKFMTHLVQLAQALIDKDWGKAEASFMRFADNLEAITRNAEKAIAALNGKVEPKQEMFGPPAPVDLLNNKGNRGGGSGGKGGKSEAEQEAERLKKMGDALSAAVNPLNAFNQKMIEYDKLVKAGAISSSTYSRAVEEAKTQLTATGDALTASVDPWFAYALAMREVDKAYRELTISEETWAALEEKLRKQRDEDIKKKKGKSWVAQLTEDVVDATAEGVGDFFKNIVSGSMTASEAFSKMVEQIISDIAKLLAKLAAQQAAAFIIKTILGGAGGVSATGGSGTLFSLPAPGMSFNAARALGLEPVATATAATTGADGVPGAGQSDDGTGRWRVVINNNAGAHVSTSERADGGLDVTIEKVRAALTSDVVRGGNQFARALEGTFQLGRGSAR